MLQTGERAAWRHQAEAACIKSGAVKPGAAVVQIEPIDGPGMCGAAFPLKVAALGTGSALGYGEEPRPPSGIPRASSGPRWQVDEQRYGRPISAPIQVQPVRTQPAQGEIMRWTPGPTPVQRSNSGPAERPVSLTPPGVAPPEDDDIPDDAELPPSRAKQGWPRTQPAYNAPRNEPQRYEPSQQRTLPSLGPARGPQSTGAIMPAALSPTATLACPLVSALDRWVAEGVQPAAQKWFGSQVATIKQISAYSCRSMVGAGTSHVSEHAFGNALDISGFVLADGRKIVVKDGWRGSPEEQGFLHDVQLYACETFSTVLAPGYNAAHYDHFHVDLMRRPNGRRPCRPAAISGEVAAAKARSLYASKQRNRDYTGSIGTKAAPGKPGVAVPGADGLDEDDNDVTGSISQRDRNAIKAIAGEDGEFDDDDDLPTGSITQPPSRTLSSSPMPSFLRTPTKATAAAAGDAVIRAEERRSKNQ